MAYSVGHHPGAVWRRADLQCHTPRDRGWDGSPDLPGGEAALEAARAAWADDFVKACLDKQLTAVAITDHHDICLAGYVKDAIQRNPTAKDSLWVYPGIEITCKDNAQCLMIFDADADTALVTKGLSMLPGIMPSELKDAKTCLTEAGNFTIEELFRKVADDKHIRDRVILIPHFSDGLAHKHLNEKGHHPRFVSLDCDGVYIEQPFGDLDPVTIQKLRGEIPDWGKRRRGIIPTGDNRSATWERLGAHECWIKLGENTAEGIRQAFLADEARISPTAPTIPAERIIGLRIKSTLTGAAPISITINDGFTALIGGRGSGKSSILEYLRFGLGRTDQDLAASEVSPRRDREANLIAETLGDGFVEVDLDREGVIETWRREYGTRDHITVASARGHVETITLDAAKRRFRARAFHQKELSTTMTNPATAAEQITGIAAAEELETRRRIDQALANSKRTISTASQELAAHWQAVLEHYQATTIVEDLKRRLEVQTERLALEGVTPENLKTIEEAPAFGRAKAFLSDAKELIEETGKEIDAIAKKLGDADATAYEGALKYPEIVSVKDAISATETAMSGKLTEVKALLTGLLDQIAHQEAAFSDRETAFQEKLRAAMEQQTAQKALIEDNARLTEELRQAEVAEGHSATRERDTSPAQAKFAEALAEKYALLEQRKAILKQAADKVEEKSGGNLRARLKSDSTPYEYTSSVCAVMEGGRINDYQQRCTDWIKETLVRDPDGWRKIADKFLKIYEMKIMVGSPVDPAADVEDAIRKLIFGGTGPALTANQVKRIYTLLNDTTVSNIISAAPKDYIILTYKDDAGRSVSFDKASPGQQASALLELLLRQSAGTLIVDQPEDDLDNRVIMRIVSLIRTSKHRRQLIFTTHNPNMVVNGDADKVVALCSGVPEEVRVGATIPVIQVEIDGAIETSSVRDAITKVMEGGKEAFDLRSRKYRFET